MEEEEILFYGPISDFTVASFIQRLNTAKKARQNINVLANSFGGDADAGYGMIVSFRNFPFRKKLTVHGAAYSMMAFGALYAGDVEAIEQSQFLFHRAAAFFEDDDTMRALLRKRNQDLRRAMEEKLDIDAFERISGVTLDELFDMDGRIEVVLDAQQAQEIGLVSKIIPLSADDAQRINNRMMAASAEHGLHPLHVFHPKNSDMNIEELKTKHPDLYAEVLKKGSEQEKDQAAKKASEESAKKASAQAAEETVDEAVKQERDRINAWLAWKDTDPKAVFEGIASGEPLSQAKTQEFIQAGMKNGFVASLENQNKPVAPGDEQKQEEKGDPQLSPELNAASERMKTNVLKELKKYS